MNTTTPQKQYPLWQQFVDRQQEWIGGILCDKDVKESTKIKGIHIDRHEGYDVFRVEGDSWDCSFNIIYGGVSPSGQKDTVRFCVPAGGMSFTITKP